MTRTLWAVSDLHVTFAANQAIVDKLSGPHDWLIVAGDVAEKIPDIVRAMKSLVQRFAKVIWVPGNHELFNRKSDRINGKARYRALVGELRAIGVVTPEDPFPVFGPVTVCPLFTLYDYSWRPLGLTAKQAIERATVVLDDELAISPYVNVEQWCRERVEYSQARLDEVSGPTVLVNHWPLVVEPTHRLRSRDVALWSGTDLTRDWAVKYRAQMVVHGHLHIPAETRVDGVSHVEVSLGTPFDPPLPASFASRPWPFPVVRV
ncbi:metallophosphoesterase [Corynebacterium breve]|uniref:Metallophosphoesterase n=1 Tax=Corynebacterium breve TaxID=3049799 RepID=A0ABY8VGB5_9CORY|nr:metallophosphoesterase [Corynebacterium breve]WIM67810.1 metallophosphoesterase [Corynebacterium breve]